MLDDDVAVDERPVDTLWDMHSSMDTYLAWVRYLDMFVVVRDSRNASGEGAKC